VLGQCLGDAVVHLRRVVGQVDEGLGAAVELAPLVVEQTTAQGLVGHRLLVCAQGQRDLQPARVELLAEALHQHLSRHLGGVVGTRLAGHDMAHLEFLGLGLAMLLGVDEAVLQHAVQDVLLAQMRPARVGDRVVGRRCLGQSGQHRRLRRRQLRQWLAEIHLGSRREAIGPVAQEDVVQVDLKNLLLGQRRLDLECKQYLVDLANQGFLGAQIEIPCHLHGDRGGALAARFADIGQSSAQHAPSNPPPWCW
jgi:hypothetical protein